ncbi:MAG: hypothetical protein IJ877_04830 [Candidatus Gastranaerophilales bacterium]|nr:hypothetical protein [Candidatus Gastranaerophilales bacterium]
MGEYSGMKKYSLWILLVLFLSLPSFASQNIINSVLISKSKEDPTKYELSIDSTEAVQYKLHKDEQGVWFELKNSTLAQNAGTIYDDVSDIDSVSVKATDKNRVNIYLQGKNVENTELVFINSLFDTKKEATKQIMLSKPISDYQSTDYTDDLEEDSVEWSDNSFNFSHLGVSVLKALRKGPMGMILVLLAIFAILAVIIKSLAEKLSQEQEPLIGLNNNYAKDSELIRNLNHTKALTNAQNELSKAHLKYQNYLKDKYQDDIKAPNIDMVKKSIALNQYQKSTTNPYKDQEVIKINKDFTSRDNFQIPPRPKATEASSVRKNKTEFTSPYIQRKTNKVEYTPKKEAKAENMKFLESVTKIYEQSGRNDLAQGLRSSMSRVK